MDIEVICTGDEVLTGKIVNSNFSYITQKLEDFGLAVKRGVTVGDDREQLLRAFQEAGDRADAVIELNRAQIAAQAAQPYAERMRGMVTKMAQGVTGDDHPLFEAREDGKSLVVLFTSDRGLCGGFNNNLSRMVQAGIGNGSFGGEVDLLIYGRTGNDFFRRRGVSIVQALTQLREAERRDTIGAVIGDIVGRFLAGEVGRVHLAYNQFFNAIRQEPRIVPLLPVVPPEAGEGAQVDEREVLFEPDRAAILDSLVPKYLENQLLNAHLNSEAGEHGARMVAMDGATRNAGEMIDSLTLQYNRARQAVITKELIDIVSGAEAL